MISMFLVAIFLMTYILNYYFLIFLRASELCLTLVNSCTLDYQISMGVHLLIFFRFSTQHALIPYHTFINPRPLLLMKKISIVFQSNFNIFSSFFGLKYRFDVIYFQSKFSTQYDYSIP